MLAGEYPDETRGADVDAMVSSDTPAARRLDAIARLLATTGLGTAKLIKQSAEDRRNAREARLIAEKTADAVAALARAVDALEADTEAHVARLESMIGGKQ
jgi:hypothetical protein